MKKIFYILSLIFLSSCSLDIPIEDSITGLDAIDNVEVANEALSGVYLTLPKKQIVFSILADDFYPNHNISREAYSYNLYKWNTTQLIDISINRWESYYNAISKLNILINRIPEIKIKNKEEEKQLKFIEAQALGLKAYCYFMLIQLYTKNYDEATKNDLGIILKDKTDSQELPRASLEKSYIETEKLLNQSISLFDGKSKQSYRLSKKSTKAILAKLYLAWQKYEKAINLCNELINNGDINQESYDDCWFDPEGNSENLFAFERIPLLPGKEKKTVLYFSDVENISGKQMYYANRTIEFSQADYRKPITFFPGKFVSLYGNSFQANFFGKYRKSLNYNNAEPIMAIRTAEIYFIKAEAEYHLGLKEKSKTTLNTFLSLRDANPVTIDPNEEGFLNVLLKEKQKEFLGEGLRFFDLKRNKQKLERVNYRNNKKIMDIEPDDFRWVFPIPFKEIKHNKNAKQNPKWNQYVY